MTKQTQAEKRPGVVSRDRDRENREMPNLGRSGGNIARDEATAKEKADKDPVKPREAQPKKIKENNPQTPT
ncbi:hypothetical protein [Bowmanella dokdonensis]|uniref:Uncharacterized protein n=1 Tax=Bowmanella dokdonensis TaxID=751969 RepID=A0A939ILK2_9ALTE|nr:hypothetical protein [Bowmanella dokdonensis]MBN7824308.1 hypothetical protein [Bowmanella dokdonensis]